MTNESAQKQKVLIVDDDVTSRMLLRASITQWNYSVTEASDGEEALSILQGEEPPLILILDWMMPKLSGIELCLRMKEKFIKRPYIILLTHNKGTTNLVKSIESGADEFLEKPISLEELRCRLIVGSRIITGKYANVNSKYPFKNNE